MILRAKLTFFSFTLLFEVSILILLPKSDMGVFHIRNINTHCKVFVQTYYVGFQCISHFHEGFFRYVHREVSLDGKKIWAETFKYYALIQVYFMFSYITTQKHFIQYFISQIGYDVGFTVPNNKIYVRSLYDHMVSLFKCVRWRFGHDFDYAPGCACAGIIDSTK